VPARAREGEGYNSSETDISPDRTAKRMEEVGADARASSRLGASRTRPRQRRLIAISNRRRPDGRSAGAAIPCEEGNPAGKPPKLPCKAGRGGI